MRIIESERLSERVKKIVLEGNLGSSPGQYAMIWVPKVGEIPISIAREPEGETWILVAKVGKVSSAIHSLKVGEELWVRGPYGRGFSLRNGNCCLIGGGYGISPLISLSERLKERGDAKIRFYAGFKRREEVLLEDLLSSISDELIITTEDGSYGLKGRVIELVDFDWPEAIYSAGPEAMLVEVVREALRRGIYAEVSMERLIRCSIGICGSCSLDPLGLLVCKDGPIFDARTISLSEDFGRYWRGFDGRKLHIGGESIGMLLR